MRASDFGSEAFDIKGNKNHETNKRLLCYYRNEYDTLIICGVSEGF